MGLINRGSKDTICLHIFHDIVTTFKWVSMWLDGHVLRIEETRNVYRIFILKLVQSGHLEERKVVVNMDNIEMNMRENFISILPEL